MTPEQVKFIQTSFESVKPISDTAAGIFYKRLFEIDPAAEKLFEGSNMAEQGRKLMSMIGAAVNGLKDLDAVVPTVQALGRRHVAYGVTDKHYDTVGEALLWTLEQGLGSEFTPEVKEAWATVYATLATVMKEAAAEAAAA